MSLFKPFDISQDSDGAFYINEIDGRGEGIPRQVSVFVDSDGNILAELCPGVRNSTKHYIGS